VKLLKSSVIVIMAMLFATQVLAQGKIAILSVEQAILNTEMAKQRMTELQKTADYADKKAVLDKLQKDGEGLVVELNKSKDVMSAEQRETQLRKINTIKADMEHVAKQLQQVSIELQKSLIREMGPSVNTIVQEIIKVEGIGLLLNAQAAMHADSSFNITAKVTDKLNQAN